MELLCKEVTKALKDNSLSYKDNVRKITDMNDVSNRSGTRGTRGLVDDGRGHITFAY